MSIFGFFGGKPPGDEPPKISDPHANQPGMPPLGQFGEEELSRYVAWTGRHLRLLDSGAQIAPGAQMSILLQVEMLQADIMFKLLTEIRGLRDDLALARGSGLDVMASLQSSRPSSSGDGSPPGSR